MAVPKTARVVGSREIAPGTKVLDLALADGTDIGFRGGQYVIVNTGVTLPEGKLAKRAYSFFSHDTEQRRVQIAVKRLDGGPGSGAMHDAPVGTELSFSGPWGKLYPEGQAGRTLVLATDTGITAALGLARSSGFAALAPEADVYWYVTSPAYFLPEAFVHGELAGVPVRFHIEQALPPHHPERLAHVQAIVGRHITARGLPASAFFAGDGAVIHPIRDHLVALGVPGEHARLEAFFNNPARKAP
jgi:ferredoxin-NADP reductase